MFDNYPDVLTVQQIMVALGIGKNSAYELLKTNAIKSVKIGNRYKVPKSYLIEFCLSR